VMVIMAIGIIGMNLIQEGANCKQRQCSLLFAAAYRPQIIRTVDG
jgi:hypothetical protein